LNMSGSDNTFNLQDCQLLLNDCIAALNSLQNR
jgi:hypothetical protein